MPAFGAVLGLSSQALLLELMAAGPSYREAKGGALGPGRVAARWDEFPGFRVCLLSRRFDLDHSLFSGVESKAADRSVRSTQTNPPGAPPIHDRSRGECLDTWRGVSDV
jgi:hypothetical protein